MVDKDSRTSGSIVVPADSSDSVIPLEAAKPQSHDIVTIAKSARFLSRAKNLAVDLGYSYQDYPNIEEFAEKCDGITTQFLIVVTEDAANKEEAIGIVQVAKQISPNSFILVVISGKVDPTSIAWIRKSGADVVLQEDEFIYTCKLEYFVYNTINSEYHGVKAGDLIEGTTLNFTVFTFMTQNRKYLPVVHKSMKLEEKKLAKMREHGDFYIKHEEVPAYENYLSSLQDSSAKGLVRRCRLQYLQLRHTYFDLVVSLTEKNEKPSLEEGKTLLQNCMKLSNDLLNSIMTVGQIQDIIESPLAGNLNSVDRAVDRSAIAGFFSMLASIGNPEDVMLSALIMDLGILGCAPNTMKKLRAKDFSAFTQEDRSDYQSHPQRSLNFVLSRKLQISNSIKDAVNFHHAIPTEKGFPVLPFEKIPLEAQLLRFCENLDLAMTVYIGKPKPSFRNAYNALMKEAGNFQDYSPQFVQAMREVGSYLNSQAA